LEISHETIKLLLPESIIGVVEIMTQLSLTRDEIKERLNSREPVRINHENLKPAAVLVPLFVKDGEWHLLFTLRTGNVSTHRNEMSFPGGGRESGENSLEAALREAEEEVGLRPEDVDILGRLDDIFTITGFRVSPFVGVIPYPYAFEVCRREIARIVEISLRELTDPRNCRRDDSWKLGDRTYPIYFFHGAGHTVWGATARILKQLLELVFEWEEPQG